MFTSKGTGKKKISENITEREQVKQKQAVSNIKRYLISRYVSKDNLSIGKGGERYSAIPTHSNYRSLWQRGLPVCGGGGMAIVFWSRRAGQESLGSKRGGHNLPPHIFRNSTKWLLLQQGSRC